MLCINVNTTDSTYHIVVSSDTTCGIDISSDSQDFIEVSCEQNDFCSVNSENQIEGINISGTFTSGLNIYSSYVCTISKEGYLYLQEMDNTEPITIFIYDYMEVDVNVFSNLNWNIT